MRTWNLDTNSPFCLTLACDSRLHPVDYSNDQIWELSFSTNEPAGISFQTTYGLRARQIHFLPRYTLHGESFTDPKQFHESPIIKAFFPNYIAISYQPFASLEVFAEYWVPDSHSTAGRIKFLNLENKPLSFRFEWVGLLKPLESGMNMVATQEGPYTIMRGKTSSLIPVCAISGDSDICNSPYPSLSEKITIPPGKNQLRTWALSTTSELVSSLERVNEILACSWDAEIARIEMINRSQSIEIHTGDSEWDAVFALTQKLAFSLYLKDNFPNPPFILSRLPDQGFLPEKDKSNYTYPWKNSTILDAYFLSSLILPGGVETSKEILNSILKQYSYENEGGDEPENTHGQPILATLAWIIHEQKDDPTWLAGIYPSLLDQYKGWFDEKHDRDQDGFPEWVDSIQSGLEQSPIYDLRDPDAQGLNIFNLETPSLAAFLYKEGQSLIKIAEQTNARSGVSWLKDKTVRLQQLLEECWDAKSRNYQYRDMQSHRSPSGTTVKAFFGSGTYRTRKSFAHPSRLVIHLKLENENTRRINMMICGKGETGSLSEEIMVRDFTWSEGFAQYTTKNLFLKITSIEISGLHEQDHCQVKSADYTQKDITQLMPLWAGMISKERAKLLVEGTIKDQYIEPFGIPVCPQVNTTTFLASPADVHMHWNHLVGEGLINYGYYDLAAELITRIMKGLIKNLKKSKTFREMIHCKDGKPSGTRNHLRGLAPLGLFMRTLGVQYIKEDKIILHGNNPFPWPVTIKYRNVSLTRHLKETLITFQSGRTITVSGSGTHEISLDSD